MLLVLIMQLFAIKNESFMDINTAGLWAGMGIISIMGSIAGGEDRYYLFKRYS